MSISPRPGISIAGGLTSPPGLGIGGLSNTGGGGPPPPTFPLDGIAVPPTYAFSARTMRTAQVNTPIYIVRVAGPGTYGTPESQYAIMAPNSLDPIGPTTPVLFQSVGTPGATTLGQLLTQGGNNDLFAILWVNAMNTGIVMSQPIAARQTRLTSAPGVLNVAGTTNRPALLNANGTGGYEATGIAATSLAGGAGDQNTIACVSSGTASQNQVLIWWSVASTNQLLLHDPWIDNNFYYDTGDGNTTGRLSGGSGTNAWSHTVARRAGSVAGYTKNGVSLGGSNFMSTGLSGTATLQLLNRAPNFNEGQNGSVGEIVIWNSDASASVSAFLAAQRTWWGTP